MYPGTFAITKPDHPAVIFTATGETITYRQLNARSNKIAHLFRNNGVTRGEVVAIFMENLPEFIDIAWACQRSGLYYCAISSYLKPNEIAYILNDCKPKVFITSEYKHNEALVALNMSSSVEFAYIIGDPKGEFKSLASATQEMPDTNLQDEVEGLDLLYSSGTTGNPKGVKIPLSYSEIGSNVAVQFLLSALYGADENTIYLSPAPLYHAAPLRFTLSIHRIGGTTLIMDKFSPEEYLKAIQHYGATHSQVVPTMFVRLLKLDKQIREKYDISSLKCVIHAAAPCPIPIKEQIIDWFGPIIQEYYAGTEGNGFVAINSYDWLKHKGSVGKALVGKVHILDDDENELDIGQDGIVYFDGGAKFEYLNDPEKTKKSRSKQGYSTLGDVGHLDEDGFLYLTDRKAYMIISGGVNVYPQEAENLLTTHEKVADVAVFGIPDPDLGEQVIAVVQPTNFSLAGKELEEELIDFCRQNLSKIKCPKRIDFLEELPRLPTGKLYKRLLRDNYITSDTKN
jgi:acyl-CoA synthetase (AMP-forming)/AMP-acid ligase II